MLGTKKSWALGPNKHGSPTQHSLSQQFQDFFFSLPRFFYTLLTAIFGFLPLHDVSIFTNRSLET
jgi:hypothetical protein